MEKCTLEHGCVGITHGTKNGIANNCVTCVGTSVLPSVWGNTYFKGATKEPTFSWTEVGSSYCSANWSQIWPTRTIESLSSCKRRCGFDPNCIGVAYGTHDGIANACVRCQSV